ncbi:MAG TPA: hypothetical protein ENJ82_08815 [Bacteroidetes bacterium]|nr:hypothetical protein [Bacteroidota bacterium]
MNRFGWQHGLVLFIGLLVFVLLIFADKTNLKEESATGLGGATKQAATTKQGTNSASSDVLLSMLAPLEPVASTSKLLSALQDEKDPGKRSELLREIVTDFRNNGRLDAAAVYAGELADQSPDTKNLIVAGALFRNAALLPAVSQDSSLFRMFSDEALRHLNQAVSKDSRNEDAHLELGLALVEARKPELAMQGILKIREVVEMNPQNTEALFHLGKFSMDTGQFDKAAGRFRSLLEIEPKNHQARYMLALAVGQLGKFAEYKKLMAKVAAQQDDSSLASQAIMALNKN